jgi:hypothetical protein
MQIPSTWALWAQFVSIAGHGWAFSHKGSEAYRNLPEIVTRLALVMSGISDSSLSIGIQKKMEVITHHQP